MVYADHFIMVSKEAAPYEEFVPNTTENKSFFMNPIHSSNCRLYEASAPHYEFDSRQNTVRKYPPTYAI